MGNKIGQGDLNLVSLDYSSLLAAILKALQNTNPFRISQNGKQLFIDIDEIAYDLAINPGDKIESPLASGWRSAKVATTNFSESSKDSFIIYNRDIRDCLQQHLESLLKEKNHKSIEDYLISKARLAIQ